jgi:flagellar protein FlbD
MERKTSRSASTKARAMIRLTRLNNQPLVINSDLIKFVENAPDTVLTLINGEKLIVRETSEQVLERVIQFRRAILEGLAPNVNEPPRLSSIALPGGENQEAP